MIDQEMTPQEIKDQKPYLEWGLTEKEYDYICDHLIHRLPNYTETGLFAVMWSEHCSYKKSKPLLKLFPNKMNGSYKAQGKEPESLILVMIKPLFSRLKVITTHQPLNLTKGQQPGLAEFYGTSLVWEPGRLLHLIHCILVKSITPIPAI